MILLGFHCPIKGEGTVSDRGRKQLKKVAVCSLLCIVLIFGPTMPGLYEHIPKIVSSILVSVGIATVGWILADLALFIFKRR